MLNNLRKEFIKAINELAGNKLLSVELNESKQSESKYLNLRFENTELTIRFSDHNRKWVNDFESHVYDYEVIVLEKNDPMIKRKMNADKFIYKNEYDENKDWFELFDEDDLISLLEQNDIL